MRPRSEKAMWVARLLALVCGVCVMYGAFAGGAEAARAATYVVDQAAPGAADTNPGTEEKPWKTIQHAADAAQAGDTVCVCEGNYPERVTLKNSGAEGKVITFRSCPRRGAEVYGFSTGKADWVRIEGFRVRDVRNVALGMAPQLPHTAETQDFLLLLDQVSRVE